MKECGLDVPPFLRVNKLSFVGMIADSFVEKVCTYHAYIVSKIEKEMGHVSSEKKPTIEQTASEGHQWFFNLARNPAPVGGFDNTNCTIYNSKY